ncbi:hypothetical protein BDV96DRAFT_595023 [Lophiotrema nucula]|uniref:Arrestin-like N-terminal domain-containing protein n=1 Tax=Lophiotrema nucula TaxID=690887 RepID=A0A6A5ZMF6_9PLEO|nr:hypothetical protein BDV96DRAFT_595023 [Lophiotrema nucula]
MAFRPDLRVLIDGDTARIYRQGDEVKGSVSLLVNEEEEVKVLKVKFIGACTTRTTRPFYIAGNDANAWKSRRDYEERIELFNFERTLVSGCLFVTDKKTWNFDFRFPDLTKTRYSRWSHGSKYMKEPHTLPPSFRSFTESPGGLALISYYIEASLVRLEPSTVQKTTQVLAYQPSPRGTLADSFLVSRVLYAQTWKPLKQTRTAMDKVFNKVSKKSTTPTNGPRIIPTMHVPEKVAPRQHIPLLLSLSLDRDIASFGDSDYVKCTLDSVNVTISTFTTSMCGKPMNQPEDTVSKHVTCISKQGLNQCIEFDKPTPLTTNFRLVDDAECVPSFKTYTITRRYTMTLSVVIKCQDRKFTIKSTTPLEILPRLPLDPFATEARNEHDDFAVDPLPLYMPREPSTEFAPDYETLYSLCPTPSSVPSIVETRTSSLASGASTPVTGATTPASEIDQPMFDPVPESRQCLRAP